MKQTVYVFVKYPLPAKYLIFHFCSTCRMRIIRSVKLKNYLTAFLNLQTRLFIILQPFFALSYIFPFYSYIEHSFSILFAHRLHIFLALPFPTILLICIPVYFFLSAFDLPLCGSWGCIMWADFGRFENICVYVMSLQESVKQWFYLRMYTHTSSCFYPLLGLWM